MTTYNGTSSQREPRRSGQDDAQYDNNPDSAMDEKMRTVNPESNLSSEDAPPEGFDARSLEDMMIEKDERTVSSSSPCLATTTAAAVHINANLAAADEVSFMTTNAPLKFVQRKSKRKGGQYHYVSASQNNLRNSLLPLVGFLELANAGDFAANVFNTIPVPTFAAVLMGIGGCVALCFCTVAIRDARLSLQNIKILRRERHTLLSLCRRIEQQIITTNTAAAELSRRHSVVDTEKSPPQPLDHSRHLAMSVYLDVNTFEFRTELVDRLLMDITMGFGALLVGVGTLMAIAGANHKIFLASNLLSGYIGNGPAALYGLIRAIWSIYVYARTVRHERAVRKSVTPTLVTSEIDQALHRRYTRVKFYALLAGPTSLVAGAASLVTATMWWGYTMLAPCIVLSWVCNTLYRKEIGYTRPIVRFPAFSRDEEERQGTSAAAVIDHIITTDMNEKVLLEELNKVVVMRKSFEFAKKQAAAKSAKRRATTTLDDASTTTTTTTTPPSITFGILTKLNLVETFFLGLVSSLSSRSTPGSGSDEQKFAKRILLSDVSFTLESLSSSSSSSSSSSLSSSPAPSLPPPSPPPRFPPSTRTRETDLDPEEGLPPPSFREVELNDTRNNKNDINNDDDEDDDNDDNDDDDDHHHHHQSKNENENDHPDTITIDDPNSLLAASLLGLPPQDDHHVTTQRQRQYLVGLANSIVTTHGLLFSKYRERYTVEYLGCLMHRLCQR